MSFRLATKSVDIPALYQLEQQSQIYPWTQDQIGDCFGEFYEVWVDSEINCYGIIRVVAEQAELINICVNPKQRRRGLAQQLICHLQERSKTLQAANMLLEVRETNAAALELYQKNGYSLISRRKAYYRNPMGREDALVLQKNLV